MIAAVVYRPAAYDRSETRWPHYAAEASGMSSCNAAWASRAANFGGHWPTVILASQSTEIRPAVDASEVTVTRKATAASKVNP